MPCLEVLTRKRVIVLQRLGYSLRDIQKRLKKEGTNVSLRSLQYLSTKFKKFHTIRDLHRTPRKRLLTAEMMAAIEDSLRNDDELTARKLRRKLSEMFPDFPDVLISTIKRCRKENGWVSTRPHYCQLIREANKLKRKEWCKRQLDANEQFEDVIFSDECTIQLDHHARLFSQRKRKTSIKAASETPCKSTHMGWYLYEGCNQTDNIHWYNGCYKIW